MRSSAECGWCAGNSPSGSSAALPSTTHAPRTRLHRTDHGVRFDGPGISLGLAALSRSQLDGAGVTAEFTLKEGEHATFVLSRLGPADGHGPCPGAQTAEEMFRDTVGYWRRWLSQCTYAGRWREMVERSALALKLLSFEPTGAIVAAPTCSLPESIGGPRNWDYRYTWVRDAAFTLYSLQRIGFTEEAVGFKDWLKDRWHHAGRPWHRPACSPFTASTAGPISRRKRSTTWKATVARGRSGSAMAPISSCNWTFTAS